MLKTSLVDLTDNEGVMKRPGQLSLLAAAAVWRDE
jgi:hypothetical protein